MSRFVELLLALPLMAATGCSSAPGTDASQVNGRTIFQTGRDLNGMQIVAQHRPLYSSCAACHLVNGAGGVHLPSDAISADLRYKSLVSNRTHPYTLQLLKRAISTGIDEDGQPLNSVMPHWKLSKRDLHDVAYYVLTELK